MPYQEIQPDFCVEFATNSKYPQLVASLLKQPNLQDFQPHSSENVRFSFTQEQPAFPIIFPQDCYFSANTPPIFFDLIEICDFLQFKYN